MADEKKRDYTIEMGDKQPNGHFDARPRSPAPPMAAAAAVNNPVVPILAYCFSSILMTTTNKYVLTGDFNLNFFLLAVQVRADQPCILQ